MPFLHPSSYWLSEKLDGVGAYWNGSQFLSRQGNLFHAPDWFVAGLPNTPLDGELWLGRKKFQRTVSIVRRQDQPGGISESEDCGNECRGKSRDGQEYGSGWRPAGPGPRDLRTRLRRRGFYAGKSGLPGRGIAIWRHEQA